LAPMRHRLVRILGCQVEPLISHPEYPDGLKASVEALRRGSKLEAIKVLRTLANCGLKEAKDAVELHMQPALDNKEL